MASLAALFEQLPGRKWDVLALSVVRRTDDAYAVLENWHVTSYCGLVNRRELEVGFIINKDMAGSTEEFYTINKMVTYIVIKRNKAYKLKVVQAYAPTYSYDEQLVESFYGVV